MKVFLDALPELSSLEMSDFQLDLRFPCGLKYPALSKFKYFRSDYSEDEEEEFPIMTAGFIKAFPNLKSLSISSSLTVDRSVMQAILESKIETLELNIIQQDDVVILNLIDAIKLAIDAKIEVVQAVFQA